MEKIGADFRPLIRALELASADQRNSLEQQLGIIELALVEAQLNPNTYQAIELRYSLEALRQIDPRGIAQARGTADLEPFFQLENY